MTAGDARPLWRGRVCALIGIVLFAFSLRSAVGSLSPLLGLMHHDFTIAVVVLGLTGTAAPVCYAVFGLLTPGFERRLGLERLALIAMAVVTVGLIARALAVDEWTLLASTIVLFAAIGTGNILLPPMVNTYFPDRVGLVATIYATAIAFASFVPPLVAVPVADVTSSWRASLGLWALFAAGAVIPWIVLLVRRRTAAAASGTGADDIEVASPRLFGRMWRLPLAWALTLGFLVSGVLAYTTFTWLPIILVDIAGVTFTQAGALLALFATMALPTSLIVPVFAVRFNASLALYLFGLLSALAGIAGLLFIPATLTWLWVALLGNGGLLFPLTFVLLSLRTRTPQSAVALSGFVQSIGYAIVALFPVGIGLLHDATGSWTGPLLAISVVLLVAIPAAVVASRPHRIEDAWERRHHRPW